MILRFRMLQNDDVPGGGPSARIAFLYGMTSQRRQQIPYRLRLIRKGIFQPSQLVSLALGDDSLENPELANTISEKSASDPAIMITLARIANEEQRYG